jgi:cellobiose-specific phosphotransferase system component IIB
VLVANGAAYHVPVAGIPPRDYALADGQHVLEQAISLADNH